MQTLYKTDNPDVLESRATAEDFAKAEYRQLLLSDEISSDGTKKPTVQLYHGWYDGEGKEAISGRRILSDAYDTWEEAQAAYNELLQSLKGQGYVHSFSKNPYSSNGHYYEKLT